MRDRIRQTDRKTQVSVSLNPFHLYVIDREINSTQDNRSAVMVNLIEELARNKEYTRDSGFNEWLVREGYVFAPTAPAEPVTESIPYNGQ